jgi:hypothetical protein
LREVVAVEVAVARAGGVRQVDVGHAPAGHLVHLAAVAFDPGEAPQVLFALDRDDSDLARAAAVRVRSDLEPHLPAGGLFEGRVDVVGRRELASRDGEDVFARLDVDARPA